jgi:ATP-dependent Lon protease
MHDPLLPLFPLEVVLLPGTPMPLHIFEERYKEMVGDAISNKTEFGIVQASENGILSIGCTATVDRILRQYPDGKLDVIVVGRRRFEIIMVDQEKEYLRAEVAFFDDDDASPAPTELKAVALAGLEALQTADESAETVLPNDTDPQLSFKIGFFVPDLPLRQTLLTLRSETERLRQLSEFLPEYIAKARRTAFIRKIAPQNGNGLTLSTRSSEE